MLLVHYVSFEINLYFIFKFSITCFTPFQDHFEKNEFLEKLPIVNVASSKKKKEKKKRLKPSESFPVLRLVREAAGEY